MRTNHAWLLKMAFVAGMSLFGTHASAQLVTPAQRAHFTSDYSRYVVPEQCLLALARAEYATANRVHPVNPDTFPYLARGIPVTDNAAREIRQCAAQLRPATTPVYDFPALISVYLLGNQSELAKTAVSNRLSEIARKHPSDPLARAREQGDLLHDVILEMLPSDAIARKWPALATEFTARLDSLGPAVAAQRQSVHVRRKEYAWALGDFATADREAEQVITLAHAIPAAEQSETTVGDLGGAYLTLLTRTAMQGNTTDSMSPAGKAARAVVARTRGDAELFAKFLPQFALEMYALLEKEVLQGWPVAASPLQGSFWFNRPDSLPRPGAAKVTIVAAQDSRPEELMTLRRIATRYRARGLELVITAKTQGWFAESSVLTQEQEADSLRRAFLDNIGLPAVLGVERTSFVTRSTDGVQVAQPTPNELQAQQTTVPTFGLYKGRTLVTAVLWTIGGFSPQRANEAAMEKLIERLLQSS